MKVLVSLQVLVRLCNTLSHVKKYVMEPNVFLGYLERSVAGVLNSFGHEQYPSNSLDQNNSDQCLQCKTMRVLKSFQVLEWLCITPSHVKRYVMELIIFMRYLERGIILWPNEGIAFLQGFGKAMQYPLNCRKI